jgi:phosphatidylinositol alpha-mannosyltransferase
MKRVIVTTSWDDGHVLDMRLSSLLKKYDIAGTFYISPQDHEFPQTDLLTDDQIKTLSESFEVGAHTMTHPSLPSIPDETAHKEIEESKTYLQNATGREVKSFCYPRGEYEPKHVQMVKDAGYAYARTVNRHSFTTGNSPLEAKTTIHTYNHWTDLWKIARFANFNPLRTIRYFQWDVLAKAMFDHVSETGGVFHLWGHSWEIEKHGDWEKLEGVLAYIAHHKEIEYVSNDKLPVTSPKLLITIPYFPPYHGGTQIYAYNIAKRLQNELGWNVVIVTSGNRGFHIVKEEYEGLRLYRLPFWLKISNTPINLFWPFMLKRIIRDELISIINAHAPVPFMSDMTGLAAGNIPLVLTYHASTMRKNSFFPDLLIWLYEHSFLQILLKRADLIVCSSDFVRLGFLKAYLYKSTTITPGVDTEIFKPADKKDENQTILFVAGLTRSEQHKGLKVLINAFKSLREEFPRLKLMVVGDGSMKNTYEAYVRNLGLEQSVIFRGKLSIYDGLVEAYQQCDVLILPSLAPAESFGMVLIEAMACKRPVIGTIAGGIPLVIDDEKTGLLVASNNSPALAAGIRRLLTDPALAKRFGEAGLEKVRAKYNWLNLSTNYSELFKNIMRKKPRVVQIVSYYPPHLGGMERVVQEIALQLARDDYSVAVLTSDIEAKKLPDVERSTNLIIRRLLSFEFAHTAWIPEMLWNLLNIRKPAVFHLHLAQVFVPEMVWVASKLRGIPYVVHFHLDVEPSGTFGFIFVWWKRWIQPIIIKSAAHIITLSPDQSKLIESRYGIPSDKITFIGNGVSEKFLEIGKMPREFHTPLRLLSVGRLASQKRPERLVEALSLVKSPVTLTLVGDGEDCAKLEELTAKLALKNVVFRGILRGEALLQAYRDADVFVISSDREGMSLAILEAMGTALPVVGSDVLGIHEAIDGVGVLVPDPSPETFAHAIDDLAAHPERLPALSAASYKRAQEYSWDKLVNRLEEVYKSIKV